MKPLYLYPNKENAKICRLEHYKSDETKCMFSFKECYIKALENKSIFIFKHITNFDNVKLPKGIDQWDYAPDILYYLVCDSTVTKVWDFDSKSEVEKQPSVIESALNILISNRFIKDDLWCDGYMTFGLNNVLDSLGRDIMSFKEFESDGRLVNMVNFSTFSVQPKNQELITNDDIETIVKLVNDGKSGNGKFSKKSYSLTDRMTEIVEYMNSMFPELNAKNLSDLVSYSNRNDLAPETISLIYDTLQLLKELK